jgi:DUF1680 family protein
VEPEVPVEFSIRLRIPNWLERPAQLLVNGRAAPERVEQGKFVTLRRRWRKGDRIGLTLPFSLRAVPLDDRHPDLVAMMYGPLMLAAVNPPEHLAANARALVAMNPISGSHSEFECPTGDGKVRMRPWYRLRSERYSVYFNRTAAPE